MFQPGESRFSSDPRRALLSSRVDARSNLTIDLSVPLEIEVNGRKRAGEAIEDTLFRMGFSLRAFRRRSGSLEIIGLIKIENYERVIKMRPFFSRGIQLILPGLINLFQQTLGTSGLWRMIICDVYFV